MTDECVMCGWMNRWMIIDGEMNIACIDEWMNFGHDNNRCMEKLLVV